MKKLISICLIMMFALAAFAQNRGRQQIDNAKVALITNRLNLTTEQAQNFWPLYREYDAKHREVTRVHRKLISEVNTLTTTDDKILANLREIQSIRQKEVDLSKDYMVKFLKVINPRQLAELYKTEDVFAKMLLKRLEKVKNQE